ncbi:hypothetical protein MTBBW1_80206 [Desulfamplus magnetovallimortis]|uniref:Uncharacterized protein n=1 Tax=Desulfamplus magnetovallimortis TaxID=1246637 RepID=L0R5L3_9BACT|nr:hypothetical protein [Desulfamplus magnetovallimortis]CCO06812.1 hypothetical protein DEMABW1_80206 [Desulfamplus magnetovallimortis BW-1]SLM32863.1 hypothetical protein MTBBW1_80206 [Desulfamplus magnetovallimortis]
MQKKIWITALSSQENTKNEKSEKNIEKNKTVAEKNTQNVKGEKIVQQLLLLAKKYGLAANGHFWVDDIKKNGMADSRG